MEELRRLLPGGSEELRTTLPLGIAAVDDYLPQGGLACGALHEIVPEGGATPAAFGFIVALLARLSRRRPIFIVMPGYGFSHCGRLSGHGLSALGLDPERLVLAETTHWKETLWAIEEALRSRAPGAVAAVVDKLDLKSSQRLHFAATNSGLPLLLLRPAQTLESSAAATRWHVGPAPAARERFGLFARARWHLSLERCRNGRPGEWMVEYDHVAHRFSLAAALADHAHAGRAGEKSGHRFQQDLQQACRS